MNGTLHPAGHHHGAGLTADLLFGQHMVVKVVHHDLRLLGNGMLMAFDVTAELLFRLLDVKIRVVLHRLGQVVVTLHRGVVFEHIKDEAFIDGLLHGVAVKRAVFDHLTLRPGFAKDFQGFVLGRGGERKIAGIGEHLA